MFDQQIPAEFAEYFGVYVSKPNQTVIGRERLQELYRDASQAYSTKQELARLMGQIRQGEPEIERLNRDRHELMRQRDALQSELARQRDRNRELSAQLESVRRNGAQDWQRSAPSLEDIVVEVYLRRGSKPRGEA
jgi:predicted nuclease with TOPRIM domain